MSALTTVRSSLARARSELRELEHETSPFTEATMGTAKVAGGALAAAVVDTASGHMMIADKIPLSLAVGFGTLAAGVGAESRDLIQIAHGMIAPSLYGMASVKLASWSK
jgi:uncharacterized membrane protein YebE (DUF533 family)